jgi:hypothetical protein
MCGYYAHENDGADERFMDELIPAHLEILDKCSSYFGLTVFLPYGDKRVFNAASMFDVDKLERKLPIYTIGKRIEVPQKILERKKLGLISAFEKF